MPMMTASTASARATDRVTLRMIVGDFGCSRGELNREHLVAVFAPEETNILNLPDADEARGITQGTRRTGLQETAEASLIGGQCHPRAPRSSLTAMRAASSS